MENNGALCRGVNRLAESHWLHAKVSSLRAPNAPGYEDWANHAESVSQS